MGTFPRAGKQNNTNTVRPSNGGLAWAIIVRPVGAGIWLAAARLGRSGGRGDTSPGESGDKSPHSKCGGQNRDSQRVTVTASREGPAATLFWRGKVVEVLGGIESALKAASRFPTGPGGKRKWGR